MNNKEGILRFIGLPDEFGYLLLVISIVLLMAPYFAGHDFGIFKIPDFKPETRKYLKIIGPLFFVLIIVLHLPIVSKPNPEDKLKQLLEKARSSTPPSSPPIQVNITFPADGDSVDEFITMKGTVAGDVENAHLWIVGKETNTLYYFPQGGEIHPKNGNWSLSGVRIGADRWGVGMSHELAVVQANEIMHKAFQLYFKIGQFENKWIGFDHVFGTKKLARVTVVRR
jgi:hypothetical protein